MQNLSSAVSQQLALAVSQIHRSHSLEQLQKNFLSIAPRFVDAHAYGFYLFDDNMRTLKVKAQHAKAAFLNEYEQMRSMDPLFRDLVARKTFTHSLALYDRAEWRKQPLHDFLSQWDLDYSIEAPLIHEGKVSGTLNFAIGGDKYFAKDDLKLARFLCEEFSHCYSRILEFASLKKQGEARLQEKPGFSELGVRSQQVLQLILQGKNNRAMAMHLGISENTVRYHVKQLYRVFEVNNRAALVRRLLN